MADVLSPPATSPAPIPFTTSPELMDGLALRPSFSRESERERGRQPSLDRNRLSVQSQQAPRSRPQSIVLWAFNTGEQYDLRDYAYPTWHPMHYGMPPPFNSKTGTPRSERSQSRRSSDPMVGGGEFTGPVEPLPSTSFGEPGGDAMQFDMRSSQHSQHRRSRSYNTLSEWERGRRSQNSDGPYDTMYHFGSSQLDPAGSSSLRHSRGFHKRDSHFAQTLSSRSLQTSDQQHQTSDQQPQTSEQRPDYVIGRRRRGDEDTIPLDSEADSKHAQSPQRASMGPEDELFAGESLALYAFEPMNPNELRLREGQIILVSYRHGQGWLVAEDPITGEQGLVPEEYVRLVRDIEAWDAERGAFIDENGDVNFEDEEELVDDSTQSSMPKQEDLDSGNSSEAITDRPSRAMLVEPPEVDHDEGLQMSTSNSPTSRKNTNWKLDRTEDERRQDSGHAEK